MNYKITEEGMKTLSKLPKSVQSKILDKLDLIFTFKNPLSYAKKLNNFELGDYRIRIGDYRASFDVENKIAKFLKFGHRKDFYK
ncbi:MAG: type II toxin-antitoxin system RelE/ParE family toxin [bacterium]|nr:type II toxin-antitoxin system RelE/ParE family toxin [bacterium]